MPKYDPVAYKASQRESWNANAAHYHEHFVVPQAGPFQTAGRLVALAGACAGQRALDVATGTGAVALELAHAVGPGGRVLGVDLSPGMLALARLQAAHDGLDGVTFEELDAEALAFEGAFETVTCQFGLMFFPDVARALSGMRRALVPGGCLALSVHGRPENVPFFTVFSEVALAHFPELREQAGPGPLRFSNPDKLARLLVEAGFQRVTVEAENHPIAFEDFEAYWDTFLGASPKPVVERVRALAADALATFKAQVANGAARYRHGTQVHFPWEVTFARAIRPT